jgi:hypothetical protein
MKIACMRAIAIVAVVSLLLHQTAALQVPEVPQARRLQQLLSPVTNTVVGK